MSAHQISLVGRLALLGSFFGVYACGADVDRTPRSAAGSAARPALAASGEIVVRGEPLSEDLGAVSVSIERAGGGPALVARTWELSDPIWRERRGERRLYFRVDERDRVAGAAATVTGPLDLVVRWDPDGNPDTVEPTIVEVRRSLESAASDIVALLQLGPRVSTEPDRGEQRVRLTPGGEGG
jgi:hypothetical protein